MDSTQHHGHDYAPVTYPETAPDHFEFSKPVGFACLSIKAFQFWIHVLVCERLGLLLFVVLSNVQN